MAANKKTKGGSKHIVGGKRKTLKKGGETVEGKASVSETPATVEKPKGIFSYLPSFLTGKKTEEAPLEKKDQIIKKIEKAEAEIETAKADIAEAKSDLSGAEVKGGKRPKSTTRKSRRKSKKSFMTGFKLF